jgi:MFS family permease
MVANPQHRSSLWQPTAFARLSPNTARVCLFTLVTGLLAGVALTLSPWAKGRADHPGRGANDMTLYQSVVARVAGGETYYDANADELRKQGYPSRSVFNRRTPLLFWILAALPSPRMGQAILGGLAVVLLLLATSAVTRERSLAAGALAGCLLAGALLLITGDAYYLPVMWAGVLIGLSLCAYEMQWRDGAAVLGILALFFRELAAPYCVGALVLAVWQRRWREVAVWAVGFAAYAAFFAYHVQQVQSRVLPTDASHDGTWLQAGGMAFVASLAQVNAWFLLLPQAFAAAYLALAMLGAASWHSEWGRRVGLTFCGYAATFALVGYEFNQYWGVLIAPLFALCAAHAPAALSDLLRASRLIASRPPAIQTLSVR